MTEIKNTKEKDVVLSEEDINELKEFEKDIQEEYENVKDEYTKILEDMNRIAPLEERIDVTKKQLDVIEKQLDEKQEFTYEDFLKLKEEDLKGYENVMYYADEETKKDLISSGIDVEKLKHNIKEMEQSEDLSHVVYHLKAYKLPLDRNIIKKTITKTQKKIFQKTRNSTLAQVRSMSIDLDRLYDSLVSMFPEKNIAEHQRLFVSLCKYFDAFIDTKFMYIENVVSNINLSAEDAKRAPINKNISFRSQVEGLYSLLSR